MVQAGRVRVCKRSPPPTTPRPHALSVRLLSSNPSSAFTLLTTVCVLRVPACVWQRRGVQLLPMILGGQILGSGDKVCPAHQHGKQPQSALSFVYGLIKT